MTYHASQVNTISLILMTSWPQESVIDFAERVADSCFAPHDDMKDVAIWGGGIVVAIVRSRASGMDILWITEDMRS